MAEEQQPEVRGLRGELRRIRSEIGQASFFLFFALIVTCSMCDNLDDIQGELKRTNGELRKTREAIERLVEQRQAR